MDKQNKEHIRDNDENDNKQLQGVDKAPGEETGKGELVTNKDLKGKKVDADPEKESDQPLR